MQTITINIGDLPHKLLTKYAAANSVPIEQFSARLLANWANKHIEGYFQKQMREKTYTELIQLFGEPEP